MNDFDIHDFHERPAPRRPAPIVRFIGASCGAFTVCFISILASVSMDVTGEAAQISWGIAFILGAVGGVTLPRLGQLSAYVLVIFINVTFSITIGWNLREQLQFFAIFTFIELTFFSCKLVFGQPASRT